MLSVLTVRGERGRGGASTKIGVRAARALTGLSFCVASTYTFHPVCSVRLPVGKPHNTHPYSTQAYQLPSLRWLAPWLASMVRDVWRLLEHLSHLAFGHSASALRGSSPERSHSRFQMTSCSHHPRYRETATARALCARLRHSATEVVIDEGRWSGRKELE